MPTINPPRWKTILCYLNGVQIGELRELKERKVNLLMNRMPTATFNLDIANPLGSEILGMDRLVKFYRGNVLRYIGLIVSVEEASSSESQSFSVSTASPAWRLGKRLLGTDVTHPYDGVSYGTDASPRDRSLILTDIVNNLNVAGHTGVVMGTTQVSSPSGFGAVRFKPALEAIGEVLASINSPEAEYRSVEPYQIGANTVSVQINTWYPRMGANKPNAILEYGVGKRNVSSYARQISMEGILNRAYSLPDGYPDTKDIVRFANDNTSIATRGLFEEALGIDLSSPSLRQALCDQHVFIRKNPRQIVTFEPITNCDIQPFTDYYLGDSIRARAAVRGVLRFDGMFRVYGMAFDIDTKGNETVDLELILPTS